MHACMNDILDFVGHLLSSFLFVFSIGISFRCRDLLVSCSTVDIGSISMNTDFITQLRLG